MLRRIASKLHLYLGLAAGLVLVPIGLTGSVLVFHDELDAALYPELVRVEPRGERISAEAAAAAARAAFPGDRPARMELPREAHEPYEIVLAGDGRQVYVDPYGGAVLGSRRPGETLTGWLFRLHVELLGGPRGKTVVGVTGLLLLALGVTGIVLWWRGLRKVRRGLTVNLRASGKRINYDLHGAAGAYLLVPLMVVAFTGAGLVFYGTFEGLAHRLSGTPLPAPPPRSVPRPGAVPPTLDLLLARAQAELPEARLARIDFPQTPGAAFRVRLRAPGEAHPIGLSMVYLDRYTGEVLHAAGALEVPRARRFGFWFYPLHIGSFGGPPVRMLYALLGLAPALLAVTGTLIWLSRRKKMRSGRAGERGSGGRRARS